jgi:hypothetical protein
MTSKAQKLRIKRKSQIGRPRKEEAERYPSGQIKPSWTEAEAKSVVMDARKRLHGANMNDSPHAGYTLGRIYLDGNITKEQLDAGDSYCEAIARYHRLTGVAFPSARAQSLFSVRGHEGDISQDTAMKARQASNTMMMLTGLLLRCEDGPQVRGMVQGICVMDYEHMRDLKGQQNIWLRRGLSALSDHFELSKKTTFV